MTSLLSCIAAVEVSCGLLSLSNRAESDSLLVVGRL